MSNEVFTKSQIIENKTVAIYYVGLDIVINVLVIGMNFVVAVSTSRTAKCIGFRCHFKVETLTLDNKVNSKRTGNWKNIFHIIIFNYSKM